VTFGERLYVEGDVYITASGTVTFSDRVVLRNGGRLFINDAAQVHFLDGVSSDNATAMVFKGASAKVDFYNGVGIGGSDAAHFEGVNLLEIRSPGAGQTLSGLKVEGDTLKLAALDGRTVLNLNLSSLEINARALVWPLSGGTQVHTQDLQLSVAQGIGSEAAPLGVDARNISATTPGQSMFLQLAGDARLVRGGLLTQTGTGQVDLSVAGSLSMAPSAGIVTDAGAITVRTGGDMKILRMQTYGGDIHLDAGRAVTVAGNGRQPQIVSSGDLSVTAQAGIGGFMFDRLYVDVKGLSVANGNSGDVIISGKSGLNIVSADSRSQDGWMILMSGYTGEVVGNTPTAEGNRVARISGKTIIARAELGYRDMYNANYREIASPLGKETTANGSTLSVFNAQLSKQWSDQVQLVSARDRLTSAPTDLSSPMPWLKGSGHLGAAFSVSVMDDDGAQHTATALLDAALKIRSEVPVEDVFGADMLSSWAQRSFTQREALSTPDQQDKPAAKKANKSATQDLDMAVKAEQKPERKVKGKVKVKDALNTKTAQTLKPAQEQAAAAWDAAQAALQTPALLPRTSPALKTLPSTEGELVQPAAAASAQGLAGASSQETASLNAASAQGETDPS
jgi:hypothetical protein